MTSSSFSNLVEQRRKAGSTRFVVPLSRRLSADLLTPVSAFLHLRDNGRYHFLLESVEGGEKLARYSFLGKNPYAIVEARGATVTLRDADGRCQPTPAGTLFDVLHTLLHRYQEVPVHGLPRFSGGAVGYLGYDVARMLEPLGPPPDDDLGTPDALWCFYDTVVAFDHVTHQLVLVARAFLDPDTRPQTAFDDAQARLDVLEAELGRHTFVHPAPLELDDTTRTANVSREEFEDAVRKAKAHIYEGDIFQVVLSQRFAIPFKGDRFNLYRALRQVNPSPYLFYLDYGAFALIGSSPEVLVRVEDRRTEVLPIAGTRPRGHTPEEDLRLECELKDDPKEMAEHLMLVDLGRNDLGRVCRYGSVTVDRFAYVERYSHVMHIVSSVSGLLAERHRPLDALAACFPAGTVSGAPKVRAMQLIDTLETTKRGTYAGAVGYLDFSGNVDTCITIRTMLVKDGTIFVQAGAGIVAESDPGREYEETENKARALHRAMRLATEGLL